MIFLYAIAILMGLILLTSLFIKKEYSVKRVTIIDQPVGRVFDYLRYQQHQFNFNKWWMADPQAKVSFL